MTKIANIENLYWNEPCYSLSEIGEMYEVFGMTVQRWMVKAGIPRRTYLEAQNTERCRIKSSLSLRKHYKANPRLGKDSPNWGGGTRKRGDGGISVLLPDHPNADKRGYVGLHRLIKEQELGRYLLPGEVVFHLDNNAENNNKSNLKLFKNQSALMTYLNKLRWKNKGKT